MLTTQQPGLYILQTFYKKNCPYEISFLSTESFGEIPSFSLRIIVFFKIILVDQILWEKKVFAIFWQNDLGKSFTVQQMKFLEKHEIEAHKL